MKRTLLIPLDGSDFSLQIVRVVVDFFDPRDMTLLLLRIAPSLKMSLETVPARTLLEGAGVLSGLYERGEQGYSVLAEEWQGVRDQLLAELRPEAERLRELGYTVKMDVQFGDSAQCITHYAREEGVSLIAMATHGRSGFDRLVMGSVAERVLRNVAVPVLLLRPEAAAVARTAGERLALALGQGGGLRIAVATDGATFGQRAVALASQLQQLVGGELTVLVTASEREGAGKA